MNILHILSNYKWTERAEPAADLAVGQQQLGCTVHFACGRNRGLPEVDSVAFQLRRKGIEPDELHLNKHFRWIPALRDAQVLRRMIAARAIDVVHAHMPSAHLTGALATRLSRRAPRVVRSIYNPERDEQPFRLKLACRLTTHGIVVVSEPARNWLQQRGSWPPEHTRIIEPAIDVERFGADAAGDLRAEFGLAPEDFVLGMVTAIGPRRRIDIVLGALQRLAAERPNLRLLLVGRGKIERVVEAPARALGIRDRIVLTGYCRAERLVQAYRSMDLLAYPMPGTDLSCRTVREALAAGLPVAATRTGFLPRLIEDGRNGRLVELDADSLAQAIRDGMDHPQQLAAMAAQARATAQRRFSRQEQARKTLAFYQDLE